MYQCNACNYSTDRSTDFYRHNQSKKHLVNIELESTKNALVAKQSHNGIVQDNQLLDAPTCNLCGKTFSTKPHMYRHRKHHCEYAKNPELKQETLKLSPDDKDNQIRLLQEQLNKITEERNDKIVDKDEQILYLKNQNDQLIKAINESTKNSSKAVEATSTAVKTIKGISRGMSQIINNFQNNPPMKQLEGPAVIKLLTYDNKKTENDVVNIMVAKHRNKLLKEYFGNLIIGDYKKDNPELQSVWGIDTSRVIFTIKQKNWVRDKKGVMLIKLIIDPILTKADEMINNYIAKKSNINNPNGADELSRNLLTCHEIKAEISKKKLHQKIIQYITPHFDFNKSIIDSIPKKKISKKYIGSDSSESNIESDCESVSSSSDEKPKRIIRSIVEKKTKQKKIIVHSDSDSN